MGLMKLLFGKSWRELFLQRQNAAKAVEKDMAEIERLTALESEQLSNMLQAVKAMIEMVIKLDEQPTMIQHYDGLFNRAAEQKNISKRRKIINDEINTYIQNDILSIGKKFTDKPKQIFDQFSSSYLNNYRGLLDTLRKIEALGKDAVNEVSLAGAMS